MLARAERLPATRAEDGRTEHLPANRICDATTGQRAMQDPVMRAKIEKLIASGVLQTK